MTVFVFTLPPARDVVGAFDREPRLSIARRSAARIDSYADGRVRRVPNVRELVDVTMSYRVGTPEDETLITYISESAQGFSMDLPSGNLWYFNRAPGTLLVLVCRDRDLRFLSVTGANRGPEYDVSMRFTGYVE